MPSLYVFAENSYTVRALELKLRQLQQPEDPVLVTFSGLNERHKWALHYLSEKTPRDLYAGLSLDDLFQREIVWRERLTRALEDGHYYCARKKIESLREDKMPPERLMLLEISSPRKLENTLGSIINHLKAAKRDTPENLRLAAEAALESAQRNASHFFLRILRSSLDPKDYTVPETIRRFRQFALYSEMLTKKCYGANSETRKQILSSLHAMRGQLDLLVEKICPERREDIMPAGVQLQENHLQRLDSLLGLKPR